jgi:hypothetical protein
MSFKIKNKEGEALTQRELDEDATYIYKYEGEGLAHPPGKDSIDHRWDIMIGYQIDRPELTNFNDEITWKFIKDCLYAKYLKNLHEDTIEEQHGYLDYIQDHLKPHFELINFWQEQGYTIHVIK